MDHSDSDEERPSIIQEVIFYDKPGLPKYSEADLFNNRRKLLRLAKQPTIVKYELDDLCIKSEDIIKTEEVILSDDEKALDANLRSKHSEDSQIENIYSESSFNNEVEIQSSDLIHSSNDIEEVSLPTDVSVNANIRNDVKDLKVYGRRKNIKITPRRQDLLNSLNKSSSSVSLPIIENSKLKATELNFIQNKEGQVSNSTKLELKKPTPVNIISVQTVQTSQLHTVKKILTIREASNEINDTTGTLQPPKSSKDLSQICDNGNNAVQEANEPQIKSVTILQTTTTKPYRRIQGQKPPNQKDLPNHVIKIVHPTSLNEMVAVPVNDVNSKKERPETELDDIDEDDRAEWIPEDYAEYKLKHAAKKSRPGSFRVHKCKICLGIFKSYYLLCKHKEIHLKKQNPYECRQCDSSFQDIDTFTAHIRWHQGKNPYPCKKCDEGFDSKKELETHSRIHVLKKNPPKVKRFRCDICGKEFSKLCDMERHTRVHTGEKPAECNICHKRFQQTHNLSKHLLTHLQVKPFHCDICNKKFGRIDVLNRHLLTHSLEKPFKCMLCSKGFIRVIQLQSHMRHNHSDVEFDKNVPNSYMVENQKANPLENDNDNDVGNINQLETNNDAEKGNQLEYNDNDNEAVDDVEIYEEPPVIFSLDDEIDEEVPESVGLTSESIEENQDNQNENLLQTDQTVEVHEPVQKAVPIPERKVKFVKFIRTYEKKKKRSVRVENKEQAIPQAPPKKISLSQISVAALPYPTDPDDIMESILNPQEDLTSQVIKIID